MTGADTLLSTTALTPPKTLSFFDAARTLIVDTECYPGFWCIGFRRYSDGKTLVIEHSSRRPMVEAQRDRIRNLMMNNLIVTFNGKHYDMVMIWLAISGASNAELKQANDRIIVGGMKPWHSEEVLGISVPWDCLIRKDGSLSDGLFQVDVKEVQPDPFNGLKLLAGRKHAEELEDLPYPPDTALTPDQMDHVISYMGKDLRNTEILFESIIEPLEMRWEFSKSYGVNLMSKSDAQLGEAIIKKRVEQETGEKKYKVETPPGTTFKYNVPAWLAYRRPDLQAIADHLRVHDFMVQGDGKVELPEWLANARLSIGGSVYQMGIGGLHSTEKNRSVHSDEEYILKDADCASYYPAIILNSGLYPRALGATFLSEFGKIRQERIVAKRAGDKVKDQGLKISLNGSFGKMGSTYSVLYAPHLLITITLTGQLALLMLIERAEEAGISVVSGNTDGIVFRVLRSREDELDAICQQWEADTGFELEYTEYRSLYNRSVNDYIAVKPDGTVKWKGVIANPWRDGDGFKPDLRGQLMKNPQMVIIANAVVDLITKGVPLEETIRNSNDIRDYITVVKVQGGATWRGKYLGKVVRYAWVKDGEEILRATAHKATGNHGKVPKTDGCRPLMNLPAEFPDDLDYDAYIAAAREVLMDIGYDDRPPPVKPLRIFKYNAIAWFAVAA